MQRAGEIGRRVGVPALLAFLTGLVAVVAVERGRIPFTSDQAMVGLMAQDILHRGKHPVFYQGAAYGGTLEPHYLAAVFSAFPETVATYRLAMGLLLVAVALTLRAATAEALGMRAGDVAGLALALGPAYLYYKGLTSDGAYDAVLLLGAGILLGLFRAELRAAEGKPVAALLGSVGLLGGLGWWVHPVCVVYAVPAALLLLLGRLRTALRPAGLLLALAGFAAGSFPWWAKNVRSGWISFKTPVLAPVAPGHFGDQVRRLFTHGIPTLLGGRWPSSERSVPGAAAIAVLLFALLVWVSLRAASREATPSRRAAIVALLGLALAPFLLALAMQRTDFAEPRYLLPVYLGAAPLLGLAVTRLRRPAWALALVPLSLAGHAWAPRMEDLELGFPSSREKLVAALRERGVTTAYASYWTAYRLTFLMGGDFVSTPYGRWLYTTRPDDRAAVDRSAAPAFLLEGGAEEEWEAERFEAYLRSVGAPHRRETLEGLAFFSDLPASALATLRHCDFVPVAAGPGSVAWVTPPGSLDLVAGETKKLPLTLRNGGAFAWTPNVHVGYRWRDLAGVELPVPTPRAFFGRSPGAGETVAVELPVEATVPPGRYRLVADVVDENVTWFEDRGATPLVFDATVRERR